MSAMATARKAEAAEGQVSQPRHPTGILPSQSLRAVIRAGEITRQLASLANHADPRHPRREIGDVMGRSEVAVRKLLSRARARLALALDR